MGSKKFPARNSLKPIGSILQKLFHRRRNVARLGEDDVFQLRLVGTEGVHGRNTPDRGVQLLEKFVRNTSGDFSATSPAQGVFVSHDDPVGLSNGRSNGFPVVGR